MGEWSNVINELAQQIKVWRVSKGFHTPNGIRSQGQRDLMLGKLMLVVSEVAEAAEAVRHKDQDNFEEEIADACIRLFDIAATTDMNLENVLAQKMTINEGREYRHGKNCTL